MMGFIEPEQAEQAPAAISMEQEQAVVAECEAAPREEEVIPEGTAEAEAGGIVLAEELERQGPALTNETLRDWVKRWCIDREGLPPISTWNTSQVTDFSKLFMNQYDFNDDVSAWNTSRVTDMSGMFDSAKSFNQPLNDWRVDNVTNMCSMFSGAKAFNQPLNDWRVDKVTDMSCMFYLASSFNQPLNDWRVDKLWYGADMMFKHSAFDRWEDLGDSELRSQKPPAEPCCVIS